MPTTKQRTSIWASQVLTAGGADVTSSWVDLSAGYGATLSIKITNGATGPTVPAECEVQTANDYSGGSPSLPVRMITLIGDTDNDGNYEWHFELPMGTAAVRLVAGSNTGQNVTIDADISQVTGI